MSSPFLESLDCLFNSNLETLQYVCEECHQTIVIDVFGYDGLCLEVDAGFGAIIDGVNESLVSVGGEYAGIAEAFDDHRPGIVGPVPPEEAPVQFEVLALENLVSFLADGGFDLAPDLLGHVIGRDGDVGVDGDRRLVRHDANELTGLQIVGTDADSS